MEYTSKQVYETIATQRNDRITKRKTCKESAVEFPIFQSEIELLQKIKIKIGDEYIQIPESNLCPEERMKRIMTRRNERHIYKTRSIVTNEQIVSAYSPENKYKTCESTIRRSDKVDNTQIGIEYNNQESIHEHIDHLIKNAILRPLMASNDCQNCDYNNFISESKNCYRCFSCARTNDSLYCHYIHDSKDCIDCLQVQECDLCFDIAYCIRCSKCYSSDNLIDCQQCYFSTHCINCKNCIRCHNLNNKEYYIDNQKMTKEEYEEELREIEKKGSEKPKEYISAALDILQSEKSSGNGIESSKDILLSNLINNSETIYYSMRVIDCKDCMNNYGCFVSSLIYSSCTTSIRSNKCAFCIYCYSDCENLLYCYDCTNCKDCFSCVGLKHKQYCIFNKQYTQEEYVKKVKEIIKNMSQTDHPDIAGTKERGEPLSPSISPYGYNETLAQEYYPLEKERAIKKWRKRQDKNQDPIIPNNAIIVDYRKTLKEQEVATTDIEKTIYICEQSGRPFKIQKTEYELYKRLGISLPRKHPEVRHQERIKQKPDLTIKLRNCDKTGEKILSVYKQGTTSKVYGQKSYQELMYS